MIQDTYLPETVTISTDEYSDLIRAASHLDTLLVLFANATYIPDSLIRAIGRERNITKEVTDGNRQEVLLDEAQGELHDQRHD